MELRLNTKNAMGKIKATVIFVLIIAAFSAGVYFKDDIERAYNNFGQGIEDFKKTEIGNLITEAGKEIFTPAPLNVGGKYTNVVLLKSQVIEETNIQRELNGLPALKENAKLDEAALAKANDMFSSQYFEHVSPSGVGPGELVQDHGYDYIVAGENLILGNFSSEKEVVDEWMNSPGHRANILNDRYLEIGVAVIKGIYNGDVVWIGVQEFGLPLSSCSEPDAGIKSQIDLDKMQLDALASQIDAKRSEIENTNPRSERYNQLVDEHNQMVGDYKALAKNLEALISRFNSQVNIFNNCVAGK